MSLPSERGFCTKHHFKINIISVNHFYSCYLRFKIGFTKSKKKYHVKRSKISRIRTRKYIRSARFLPLLGTDYVILRR
jgi:RNase P protein component